jgi:hypothetical protein
MKKSESQESKSPSQLIDARIEELGDWRGRMLSRLRSLVKEADPEVVEEWKWRGVPVWSHDGLICTGETYKNVVKMTFAQGAALNDPSGLFNSSLDGNTRRAIDFREGEKVDEEALKTLVRAAVTLNKSKRNRKATPPAANGNLKRDEAGAKAGSRAKGAATPKRAASEAKPGKPQKGEKAGVVLLSGGNPQIAKADGDAPVQAYIAAMPGWKSDLGKRLDALIMRNVPDVRKAVKWNSPFYGVEGRGWFLGLHCFSKYVKVAFFRGASLRPLPPGPSKDKDTRYIDIYEGDELDEALLGSWVKQAAALPGFLAPRP